MALTAEMVTLDRADPRTRIHLDLRTAGRADDVARPTGPVAARGTGTFARTAPAGPEGTVFRVGAEE